MRQLWTCSRGATAPRDEVIDRDCPAHGLLSSPTWGGTGIREKGAVILHHGR